MREQHKEIGSMKREGSKRQLGLKKGKQQDSQQREESWQLLGQQESWQNKKVAAGGGLLKARVLASGFTMTVQQAMTLCCSLCLPACRRAEA